MSEPSPYPIQSERHALLTGMAWGAAARHGLDVTPEYDENGDYAASALLNLPSPAEGITVRLIVEAEEEET